VKDFALKVHSSRTQEAVSFQITIVKGVKPKAQRKTPSKVARDKKRKETYHKKKQDSSFVSDMSSPASSTAAPITITGKSDAPDAPRPQGVTRRLFNERKRNEPTTFANANPYAVLPEESDDQDDLADISAQRDTETVSPVEPKRQRRKRKPQASPIKEAAERKNPAESKMDERRSEMFRRYPPMSWDHVVKVIAGLYKTSSGKSTVPMATMNQIQLVARMITSTFLGLEDPHVYACRIIAQAQQTRMWWDRVLQHMIVQPRNFA